MAEVVTTPGPQFEVTVSDTTVQVVTTAQGLPGPQGPAGTGVPAGGSVGQALVKASGTDYDTTWTTLNATPGGSSGQIQWNSSGAFAGAVAAIYATSGTHVTLVSQGTTIVPLAVKGISGQTANLSEWRDNTDAVRASLGYQANLANTDTLAFGLRPGTRTYYAGSYDAAGVFKWWRSDSSGHMTLDPGTGQLTIVGAGSYSYVRGINSNFVITAREDGGATTVDFNRRPSDDSSGVGGTVRCWTKTGQTSNALEVLAPGGGSATWFIRANGAEKPVSMADSAAANDSVYYSTTANKLVYKDSGGTVNNLY